MSTSILNSLLGIATTLLRSRPFADRLRGSNARAYAFDRGHLAVYADNPHGLSVPVKNHAIQFCEIVLVAECRHFFFAPAIDQVHRFRPETLRRCHDVDRRVPRADARDAASDIAHRRRNAASLLQ